MCLLLSFWGYINLTYSEFLHSKKKEKLQFKKRKSKNKRRRDVINIICIHVHIFKLVPSGHKVSLRRPKSNNERKISEFFLNGEKKSLLSSVPPGLSMLSLACIAHISLFFFSLGSRFGSQRSAIVGGKRGEERYYVCIQIYILYV